MRLLLATSALASHHHAMVPFGWAALAAGHEVRLATSPELVAAAARSGLPVLPAGPALDFPALHRELVADVSRTGRPYDPKVLYARVADLMADALVALAVRWRPDAIVFDPATLAAPVAAAACGARAVRYLWGLDIMGRGATLVERLPDSYAATWTRFGLALPEDPDWWTFDPSPPSVWPVTTGYRRPVRYVPYSPQAELGRAAPPGGRAPSGPDDRPRVLLTFGAGIAAREVVPLGGLAGSPVLQGILDLDVDVVLAVAPDDAAALGPLPERVSVVSGSPLPALLAGTAAIVHHGGNGTLLTAALAGVPQLVVSYLPETRFGARQFAPTGAVLHLPPEDATRNEVGAAVGECVDSGATRVAAAMLRAEMLAQPVPAELLAAF